MRQAVTMSDINALRRGQAMCPQTSFGPAEITVAGPQNRTSALVRGRSPAEKPQNINDPGLPQGAKINSGPIEIP